MDFNLHSAEVLGDYVKDGAYTNAYCDILQVLKRSCDLSDVVRRKIIKKPLLDPLLLKLCLDDPSNKILSRTIDLIYSLSGQPTQDANKFTRMPCPHEGTFQILLTRFFVQLTQFSSKLQLNLRNDTAFLICLLTRNIPPLKKFFGGYAQAIASIVTGNIFGSNRTNTPIQYLIDSTPEDAELLKYLICMLDSIIQSGSSLNIIEEYAIAPALIAVLMGPSRLIDCISQITPIESIETVAWSALTSLAQQVPTAFLVPGGMPEMLDFLKVHKQRESKPNPKLVLTFSHIFRTMLLPVASNERLTSFSEQIIPFFNKTNSLTTFIEAIVRITATNFRDSDEPTLSNFLLCCAVLGQFSGTLEREEFVESEGIRVLTRLIKQLLYHPVHERHMDPVLHISIAECALRCIADSPNCLEIFLGYEGLLRMLDLLDIGAGPPACLHILNCILELCEYPRCMDQLLFWRRRLKNITQRLAYGDGFKVPDSLFPQAVKDSKALNHYNNKHKFGEAMGDISREDHSLSTLLCDLWRDEEYRWRVLRDSAGCIASIENPIMSKFGRDYKDQCSQTCQHGEMKLLTQIPSEYPGPSCVDMIGSIRPKIFLLVKKITETVNTEAHLFDGLGLQNQLTMQIIINFLDLKRGEILVQLMQEFQEEGTQLVSTDIKTMELLVQVSKNKVAAVIETQQYLIRRSDERDEIQEKELFGIIQKCQLQDHLKAVREAEYIARTTNYTYLVEKKLWQKTQLQKAVIQPAPTTRIHRTTDGPLNITVWPGRHKIVESEPPFVEREVKEVEPEDLFPLGTASSDIANPSEVGLSMHSMSSIIMNDNKRWSEEGDLRSLNVSLNTGYDTGVTPVSAESGSYQVPSEMLRKALLVVKAQQKKQWLAHVDDEHNWKVRAKWKKDWYPEERVRLAHFGMSSN